MSGPLDSDMKEMNSAETKGFEALESLLEREEWLDCAQGQDQALAILQSIPRLATLQIGAWKRKRKPMHFIIRMGWSKRKRKPLHHFLLSSASRHLDIIEKVYNLEVQATGTADTDEKSSAGHSEEPTALHAACMSPYAADEVIRFIFQTNPSALSLAYSSHPLKRVVSPLVFLFANAHDLSVRSPPKLSTLSMLLQACPGCVKQGNEGEVDLLATAMSVGCSERVYELLWEHYPIQIASTCFRICSDFHVGPDRLGLPEVHLLGQMLPHLATLVCQPQEWTCPEAMNLLCQHLTQSAPMFLAELDISLTSTLLLDSDSSCNLWTTFLQSNTSIKKLTIRAETHQIVKLPGRRTVKTFRSLVSDRAMDDGMLLNSILCGLAANKTLQDLELSCFKFPANTPPSVADEQTSCSTLRKIQFTYCYMPSYEWLQRSFLPLVSRNLQELIMTFRQDPRAASPPDMTQTLAKFLDQCPVLQSLTVGKSDPTLGAVATNVDDLLQALQRNKSLRSLCLHSALEQPCHIRKLEALLQSGNATLQEIRYPTFGQCLYSSWYDENSAPDVLGRIPYFLLLNAFGRHTARQRDTTKQDFVQILARVKQAPLKDVPPMWRHDILFDLLGETPSVWANNE